MRSSVVVAFAENVANHCHFVAFAENVEIHCYLAVLPFNSYWVSLLSPIHQICRRRRVARSRYRRLCLHRCLVKMVFPWTRRPFLITAPKPEVGPPHALRRLRLPSARRPRRPLVRCRRLVSPFYAFYPHTRRDIILEKGFSFCQFVTLFRSGPNLVFMFHHIALTFVVHLHDWRLEHSMGRCMIPSK